MGAGAGLYMYVVVVQKFTFAISSPDEFLFVVDVDTVCLFQTRLDKFWMHQDVTYDFAADLTGIGDRSVREIS